MRMHFKRIDQLRGFAALAVVLCHAAVSAETVVVDPSHQAGHWASCLLGWGYLGVPLFFVISGLCIHLPTASALAKKRPGWRIAVKARPAGSKGFTPVRKRWVVERTKAWNGRARRNSKDYERKPESAAAMIHLSNIPLRLRKLAPATQREFHYAAAA